MTRTSILAATAIAALATSSLVTTDALARGGRGGSGGHFSRPVSVSRPVSHVSRPTPHVTSHPAFGTRRGQVASQPTPRQTHPVISQSWAQRATARQAQAVAAAHAVAAAQVAARQAQAVAVAQAAARQAQAVASAQAAARQAQAVASAQAAARQAQALASAQAAARQAQAVAAAQAAARQAQAVAAAQAAARQAQALAAAQAAARQAQALATAEKARTEQALKQARAEQALRQAQAAKAAQALKQAQTEARAAIEARAKLSAPHQMLSQPHPTTTKPIEKKTVVPPNAIQTVATAAANDTINGNNLIAQANKDGAVAFGFKQAAAAVAKTNPALAAKDMAKANFFQARSMAKRSQGETLLQTAKAENALIGSLTGAGPSKNGPNGGSPKGGPNGGGGLTVNPGSSDPAPGGASVQATQVASPTPVTTAPATETPVTETPDIPTTEMPDPATVTLTPDLATTALTPDPAIEEPTTAPPAETQDPTAEQPAGALKAISLAWNSAGAWVVRIADAVPDADADAVDTCNADFGNCRHAASVDPRGPACIVVMSNAADQSKLFFAVRPSLEAATSGVEEQLANIGATGHAEYTACNES